MAVPKRKTSISKKKMRRSHHRLSSVNIIEDKKSGEYKLSHHHCDETLIMACECGAGHVSQRHWHGHR